MITVPSFLTSSLGKRLAVEARRHEVSVLEVTPEVYDRISRSGNRQGIAVIVRQRWQPLDAVRTVEAPIWLAVDTVTSPGNLGTILRSAEAVGAAGVIFLGGATDPYDPSAVRATMGAIFGLKFVRSGVAAFARWKHRSRFQVIGTSPSAVDDYRSVNFARPTILFLGCEQRGMTSEQVTLCDTVVRIPMVGRADSLNVGVAAGVLLHEAFGQRHAVSRP